MATASELVSKGFYGYAGWPDEAATADFAATGGAGKGGPTQQQQPQPQQPQQQQAQTQGQPQAQQQGQPQQAGGSSALVQALMSKGYNQIDAQNAAVGPRAAELAREYLGTGADTGAGAGAGVDTSFLNQPTINLPEIYTSLFEKSGVGKLELDLSKKTQSFNEATSKINDNPFLSEASRVGRLQKLQTDFNNATANIKNDIATQKADIETQINLQTKQFDINSQQAQQALSQFQALLQSGALDGVSGEDIANITRATGLSSNMINSAINANKQKNIQTQVVSFDDGINSGFAVINPQTGEIINKQTLAVTEPKATTGTAKERETSDQQQTTQNLIGDIQRGATLRGVVGHYAVAGGLSVEDVYRLYNTYSPYGAAKEGLNEVSEGKFKD